MLNWRQLLTDLGVEYIDRGKNVGRGNINIACPFCQDDPSFHLSIAESKAAYYCFRNPNRHSGTSLNRLLVRLGVEYATIPAVLNAYRSDAPPVTSVRRPTTGSEQRWGRFRSAADSPDCVHYLRMRGFETPVAIARQYDLRFAPEGTWARRLILPLRVQDQLSWVGRSIDGRDPKYLAESTDQTLLYIPRRIRETVVLVEGSLDALKVSVAMEPYEFSAVGLMGKGLLTKKLLVLRDIVRNAHRVLLALDADVGPPEWKGMLDELAGAGVAAQHCKLPSGGEDPGELTLIEISDWLLNAR